MFLFCHQSCKSLRIYFLRVADWRWVSPIRGSPQKKRCYLVILTKSLHTILLFSPTKCFCLPLLYYSTHVVWIFGSSLASVTSPHNSLVNGQQMAALWSKREEEDNRCQRLLFSLSLINSFGIRNWSSWYCDKKGSSLLFSLFNFYAPSLWSCILSFFSISILREVMIEVFTSFESDEKV